jgi:hypothetical protein
MDSNANLRAVRVHGEVIVLHCWACGTAHCVTLDMCVRGELAHMVCSNSNCGMSMFLVNELVVDDKVARKQMTKNELTPRVTYSRFWK